MAGRFSAFGIPVWERDTTDVLQICSAAQEAVRHVRSEVKPGCLILHTYRFSAHSKGDDLRLPEELARIRTFDPLKLHSQRLTAEECVRAESEALAIVEDAFARAAADPFPSLDSND
jgi:TPP-dependent pyruvate/acetoin dehydrogenase alpha subunit